MKTLTLNEYLDIMGNGIYNSEPLSEEEYALVNYFAFYENHYTLDFEVHFYNNRHEFICKRTFADQIHAEAYIELEFDNSFDNGVEDSVWDIPDIFMLPDTKLQEEYKTFLNERSNVSSRDLTAPNGSFGIPRASMPQISQEQKGNFFKKLSKEGIKHKSEKVTVSKLKMTQKDWNKEKVMSMSIRFTVSDKTLKELASKPIIISKDNYILDGHHRFLTIYNYDKNYNMLVDRVDIDINELLTHAYDFDGTEYKQIHEKVN